MTAQPGRLASIIYGILDLVIASCYLSLFTWVIPSRSLPYQVTIWLLIGIFAAGGVGMIFGRRWGRRIAWASCLVMLAVCVLLLLLLLSSAAYLHGIYDGVGQAGAAIALLVAFLTIELVGLLPALQIAHLWRTRGGR